MTYRRPASLILALCGSSSLAALESSNPFALPPPEEEQAEEAISAADPEPAPTSEAASQSSPWRIRGSLRAGWDSNVILKSDADESPTDEDSALIEISGDVRYKGRLSDRGRYTLGGSLELTDYSDLDERQLLRIGAKGAAVWHYDNYLPSAVGAINHYVQDGDAVVDVLTLGGALTRLSEDRSAWIGGLGLQFYEYDEEDDYSGTLLSLRGQYWHPLAGDRRNRLSAQLRIGSYQADEDWASYLSIKPGLAWRHYWQLDGEPRLQSKASLDYDIRSYDEAAPGLDEAEDRGVVRLQGELTYLFREHWNAGAQLAIDQRSSNIDSKEYDRIRFTLSLNTTW